MPRDLFGDVTRPSISIGSRKWYTVPVSLLSHSLAVGLVIAVPILAPSMLPEVWKRRRHRVRDRRCLPAAAAPAGDSRDIREPPNGQSERRANRGPHRRSRKERPDLPAFENDRPGPGVVIGDVNDGPVEPVAPPPPGRAG